MAEEHVEAGAAAQRRAREGLCVGRAMVADVFMAIAAKDKASPTGEGQAQAGNEPGEVSGGQWRR